MTPASSPRSAPKLITHVAQAIAQWPRFAAEAGLSQSQVERIAQYHQASP